MFEVVADLTSEDLARWRSALADKELLDCGYVGYSKDEARQAFIRYYQTLGDLLEHYGVPPGSDNVMVSAITGRILRVE